MREDLRTLLSEIPHREFFVSLFGDRVWLVGGGVRDLLLGKPLKEIDLLVVKHPLEEIIEKLRPYGKVSLVGKSFAVLKFHYQGEIIEISIPRKERRASSGSWSHKNFLVFADPNLPIEEDLKRRDFTVNSMALNLKTGQLKDPLGGREDLKREIIRMTNPEAFADDPLRVLRAGRFAAKLNFKIDPEIYLRAKPVVFDEIPKERILEELYKINLTEHPHRAWEEFLPLTVLEKLFPCLYKLSFWVQDGVFHPETDAYGNHTIWPHVLLTIMQAARLAAAYSLKEPQRHALLFAALLHDVEKPSCSRWEWRDGRLVVRSLGHDVEGEKTAEEFCERLGIYTYRGYPLRERIKKLVRVHHRPSEIYNHRDEVTRRAFNRLAKELDGEYILAILLDAADRNARGQPPMDELDQEGKWLLSKFEEFKASEAIKPLIMGRDLLALGYKPGPFMGKILKKLYELQLDGVFTTKEEGLKLIPKITEEISAKEDK